MPSTVIKEIMQGSSSSIGYAPINGLQMYYEVHGKGDTFNSDSWRRILLSKPHLDVCFIPWQKKDRLLQLNCKGMVIPLI